MKNVYINDSVAIAILIKIDGVPITTGYTAGQIMNNPDVGLGICRFTAFSNIGGNAGATDGSSFFNDTAFNAFTASMVGRNIAASLNGVFLGYYTIASFVNTGSVTLSSYPAPATGINWTLVAQSNGVNVQDISCYCDAVNTGQGDAVISYGFQGPDTVTIIAVYGVRNTDGSLDWHEQARQQVNVMALTTDSGLTITPSLPT